MSEINIPIVLELGGSVKGELSMAQAKIEGALYRSRSILNLIKLAAAKAEDAPNETGEFLEDVRNACEICIALENSVFESFMPIFKSIQKNGGER